MKDALLAVKCVRLHAMKANDSRLSCALKRCNDVLPEHQAAGCQEPSALQRRRRSSANCRSIIVNMMGGGGTSDVAKTSRNHHTLHVARRTSSHVARRSSHVGRRTSHSV